MTPEIIFYLIKQNDLKELVQIKKQISQSLWNTLINSRDKDNHSVLYWAGYHNHQDIIDWLIETSDIDFNAKDKHGLNYLQQLSLDLIPMIKNQEYEKMKPILEQKGITLNLLNKDGVTAESILIPIIIGLVKSGQLDKLKYLQSIFARQWSMLINQKDKDGDTPLLWAAFQGNPEIVDWLINECKADITIKGKCQLDYLGNFSHAIIWLLKHQRYATIKTILTKYPDVPLTIKNSASETAASILFKLAVSYFEVGDIDQARSLLSLYKPSVIQGEQSPFHYIASIQLEDAIMEGDLYKVKSLLTYSLLNTPLFKANITPIAFALKHDKKRIAEYLIEIGADMQLPNIPYSTSSQDLIKEYKKIDTALDDVLIHLKERKTEAKSVHALSDSKATQAQHLALALDILEKIKDISMDASPHIYEKMDLAILINSISAAIQEATDTIELEKNLKGVLANREDAILNTRLDYCFSKNSSANKLSEYIAKKINPSLPYNQLLERACTVGRKNAWYNPIELGEESERTLPSTSHVIRLPGNELHLYKPIVESAINRIIKDKCKLISHIWFGTDDKITRPVPPLRHETLLLLKQRSPKLKRLIEYTEALDARTKLIGNSNVYQRLEILKNGLFAGDYRVTGDHSNAGTDANIAVASFSDWWNNLAKIRPDLCERIKSLENLNGESNETIGNVINIILDEGNLQGRGSTTYCVHLKANMLERMLKNKDIKKALEEMQLDYSTHLPTFCELSDHELLSVQEAIFKELDEEKARPDHILTTSIGSFPKLPYCLLNLFLIKNNVIRGYSDLFPTKNKYGDVKKIIQYVQSEHNNDNLFTLRYLLNTTDYDYLYLPDPDRTGLFHAAHYAYIKGDRTQTNEAYALLEKTITAQLVKNATAKAYDKASAKGIVETLYKENKFMSTFRKYSYHFSDSNTRYIKLFDSGQSLDDIRKELNDITDTIKGTTARLH